MSREILDNNWQLFLRAEELYQWIRDAVEGWQQAMDQLGPNGGPEAGRLCSTLLGWSAQEKAATWDDLFDARIKTDLLDGNNALDFYVHVNSQAGILT